MIERKEEGDPEGWAAADITDRNIHTKNRKR